MDNLNLADIVDLALPYMTKLLIAILTLIIGFWIAGKLAKVAMKMMRKRDLEESVVSFIGSVVNVLFKVLVLISVAGIFGVKIAAFVAVLGAMAFAVGMALQGTLGHFASGVLILIFKYYKIGDFVQINGIEGVVKDIEIFNTILTALDNRIIIVPNGLVTGNNIINYTAMDVRRIDMTFGIGYDDDIDQARSVIAGIVKETPKIIDNMENDIFVKELADSSVNFAVRVWVKTEDYWPVFFEVHEKIKKEFDKADIGIPFPQMDLHVNNLSSN